MLGDPRLPSELAGSTPSQIALKDGVGWGTKKEEQGPGKAREGPAASPEPSPSCQICEEFRSISRKIYEKPNSIEELAELREWMKGVPEKLVGLEVRWARWELEEQEPGSWERGRHTEDNWAPRVGRLGARCRFRALLSGRSAGQRAWVGGRRVEVW